MISGWGGIRTPPFAFTEQGVARLSTVLLSDRAVWVNPEVLRAFVRLRQMLDSDAELDRKPGALERRYDRQLKVSKGSGWVVGRVASGYLSQARASRITGHPGRISSA